MATVERNNLPRYTKPLMATAGADFSALKHQEAGGVVLNLLNVLIDECRVDNDTAEKENVLRNQGKIDVLLKMKGLLERDNAFYKNAESNY